MGRMEITELSAEEKDPALWQGEISQSPSLPQTEDMVESASSAAPAEESKPASASLVPPSVPPARVLPNGATKPAAPQPPTSPRSRVFRRAQTVTATTGPAKETESPTKSPSSSRSLQRQATTFSLGSRRLSLTKGHGVSADFKRQTHAFQKQLRARDRDQVWVIDPRTRAPPLAHDLALSLPSPARLPLPDPRKLLGRA
jgi:hypothetical protein